jgi:hypothetical protein
MNIRKVILFSTLIIAILSTEIPAQPDTFTIIEETPATDESPDAQNPYTNTASDRDSFNGNDSSSERNTPPSKNDVNPEYFSPYPAAENKSRKPAIYLDHPAAYTPLSFAKSVSIGIGLSYFHYKEILTMTEEISDFENTYGYLPDTMYGQPKSTEYGVLPSINITYTRVNPRNRSYLNTVCDFLIGYRNQYDGSTQAMEINRSGGGTLGWAWYPIKMKKNNFFLHTAVDLGLYRLKTGYDFSLFSGLDAKLWYRSMDAYPEVIDTSEYHTHSSETYVSFALPVGFTAYHQLEKNNGIGITAEIDVMFYGFMKVSQTLHNSEDYEISNVSYNYPAVKLGNKAQYRIEAYYQRWYNESNFIRMSIYGTAYSFGKSNTKTAEIKQNGELYETVVFHEPASTTICGGIKCDIGFSANPVKRPVR